MNHTHVYILIVKGYQNHYHMTSHDFPFVKNGVQKIHFFQILGILRVKLGPYVMESSIDAYIIIEEVKSNHNICNKSGFTIWMREKF
jgi:hypothetical protein